MGWSYPTYLKKLISLQKKALRVVVGAPYNAHTEPIFARLKLLQFNDLYKLSLLKLAHTKINPFPDTPRSPLECFEIQPTTITRSSRTTNLIIPFCPNEGLKRLCIHQVPFTYNSLNHLILSDKKANITERFRSTTIVKYQNFVCQKIKCQTCRK